MLRAEVVGVDGLTGVGASWPTEDNKLREIVIECSKSIIGPGTDARLRFIETMSASMNLVFRSVVVIGGPHVSYKTEIVNAVSEMWPPIGDFDSALPVFSPAYLHGVDCRVHVANIDFLGWH